MSVVAPRPIDWPFTGRGDETSLVAESVLAPGGAGAVVTGPRGVGKSRLVAESVRRAVDLRADGGEETLVLRAVGAPALEQVPFGGLVHLLAGLADVGPDDAPTAVAATLVRSLTERVGEGMAVLVLDDADHFDAASLALVQQLVVSDRTRVLATVRSVDGQLPAALGGLCQSGTLWRLHLGPLDDETAGELLAAALGGEVDPITESTLREASQGNPLLLANLVQDGREGGALAVREGVWTWRGPVAAGRHLRTVIRSRLDRLAAPEREALEYVAFGGGLPLVVLTDLCGPEVVDALVSAHLVEVSDDEDERLVLPAHPLYGDLLVDLVPPGRRRARCTALVEAHRARSADTLAGIVRMAAWSLEGGVDFHPEPLLLAARFANTAHDYRLGRRLARAAIDAGGGPAAALELAYAQRFSGAPDEALATLAEMEEALAADGPGGADVPGEAEGPVVVIGTPAGPAEAGPVLAAALLRSQILAYTVGDTQAARACLDRAAAAADGPGRRRIQAERSIQGLWIGRFEDEGERATALLADDRTPMETRLRLAPVVALYWSSCGRSDDAVAMVDRYLPLGLQGMARFRWAAEELLYTRHIAQTYSGELAVADLERLLGAARAQDVALHPDPLVIQLGVGRIRLLQGRADEAATVLRGVVSGMRDHDPSGFLQYALVTLAHACALQGEAQAAADYTAEADDLPPRLSKAIGPELQWSGAWAEWATGDIPRTVAALREVADLCRRHGYAGTELWTRHDLLRFGRSEEAPVVEALAGRVQGAWAAGFGLHARGLRTADRTLLDRSVDVFESMGADIHGAEIAAEAARAHAAAGQRRRAAAARHRAQRLAARCAGARTPGLAALSPAESLTRRERDVAEQAVRGIPNRRIAEGLSVSVRTVEGHLARIYAKVGVTNRVDLARALGLPPPVDNDTPVSWLSPAERGR